VSVSTQDGLRSVGEHGRPLVPTPETTRLQDHLTPHRQPSYPSRQQLRTWGIT
jgi:hypothetical protein